MTPSRFACATLPALLAAVLASTSPSAAGPLFRCGFLTDEIGAFPQWGAVGDLNGDGRPDYAVPAVNGIYIGLGAGDGTFHPAMLVAVPAGGVSLAIADVNGDGKQDVLLPEKTALDVLLGNGDGTLGPEAHFGHDPQGAKTCATGDLNGDGKLDVLSEGGLSFLGAGDGTFAGPIVAVAATGAVALGDYNEDGKLDALSGGTLSLGIGDGTFGPPSTYAPDATSFDLPIVADLNGDGHLDAAVGIYVALGHGDGTFDPSVSLPVESLAAADMNEDGILDLIGTPDVISLTVAIGLGDGSFGLPVLYPSARDIEFVLPVDLDGDGHLDLFGPTTTTGAVCAHLGNGDGTLGSYNDYAVASNPQAVAIADVSGDGRPDVIAANAGAGSISVLVGNGTGGFPSRVDSPAGATPAALAVTDFNGDGILDVATGNQGSASLGVLLATGGGSFVPAPSLAVTLVPHGVAAADFNSDGRADLVSANSDPSVFAGDVTLFLGDGAGGFGPATSYALPDRGLGIAVGDVNGDGHPDVVALAWRAAQFISAFLGDGAGGFGPRKDTPAHDPGGSEARSITVGDANGDGKLDAIVSYRQRVGIYLGNGDGTFQTPSVFYQMRNVRGNAVGDLNGDGRLDVVGASEFTYAALVRLGNGDGTLGALVGYGARQGPSSVAVGDVSGDGLPDLVVADGFSDSVSVLLHAPDGAVPALAAVASVSAEPGRVRIEWLVTYSGGSPTVYRSAPEGAWQARGLGEIDGAGRLVFVDRDVEPGATYSYRLGFPSSAGEIYTGQVSVTVPTDAVLALAGARPNPAVDGLVAAFSLPDGAPATLEVFDLAGRRQLRRAVGSLGSGFHLFRLAESRRLAPGVYWMRLTRAGESRMAKAVVAR
jgi:hypothetical protein